MERATDLRASGHRAPPVAPVPARAQLGAFFLWVALRHKRGMEPVRVVGMDRDFVYLAPPVEFLDGLEEELGAWADDQAEDDEDDEEAEVRRSGAPAAG